MTVPPPTERLSFRDWQADDLAPFHTICSDPLVMKFVGTGEPWTMERTQHFIQQAREMSRTAGFCQWALINSREAKLVGFCGLVPATDGAEIGWRLAREQWGKGLATEAARGVVQHGFESLGLQRGMATVAPDNRASIRIMKKLGMTLESRFSRNGQDRLQFALQRASAGARPAATGTPETEE